ncbi:MAG TPA: hypothetical protein VGC62_12670 [Pseudomonas sp.]|uniref:hypothetical protein n=1 Tax=Pseudomonas sp. TaxID=306 RepID=UPI002ED8A8FC
MKTIHVLLVLSASLLLACAGTRHDDTANTHQTQSTSATRALSGPQTVQLLNARYANTSATCALSKPAWYCNGVIVMAAQRAAGQTFWQHGTEATTLGAEGLAYLRSDLSIRQLPQPNGVIFDDRFTAVGNGKTLEVLCAYPLAQPIDASRSAYGCGLPAKTYRQANDVSSCLSVGVTDAPTWLTHFEQQGNQPAAQCSLSSQDPPQFAASLKAHQGLGDELAATPNQVQVDNWDPTTPLTTPVQGLFYDVNQGGSLVAAQMDQRDYFTATGQWLPVLRVDLSDPTGKVFGFNLQDQLYIGYTVVAKMNARYNDTRTECPNQQAAYYCNGVLFRSNQATTAFHAWDPSPNSHKNNGVSFSYGRSDINITKLVFNRMYGFTFKELAAPTAYSPTLRCAYPFDAATSAMADTCTDRGKCEALGITSVDSWIAKYQSTPTQGCAFGPGAGQFQLHVDVRPRVLPDLGWNEIMIAPWPDGIPEQLPLESLFYQAETARPQAQFIQTDYFTQTQRFLPVVRMDLAAPNGEMFTYDPADQLAPGAEAKMQIRTQSP